MAASDGRLPLALRLLLLATVVASQQHAAADNKHSCYRTVQNPYALFGSKTTYGAVSGNDLQVPPDCRPIQVWMVSRHGTRNPGTGRIEELKKLHEFKSIITAESTLCPEDITAIKNWSFNLTSDDDLMLQRQGVEELKSLALRLKRQFPQILNMPYDENKFKFMTSDRQRSIDSANVFYQSLFNRNPEKELPIVDESDDRFYLYKCKTLEGVKGLEEKKFKDGPLIQSVVSRVSRVMGLKENLSFAAMPKDEDVSLMYASCKFEKAWYIQSRPAWCAVFSQADFEILEYIEDIKFYYANGYGNPIGETVGCPILKDLIDNFKNLSMDKNGPSGVFYFGNSLHTLSLVTRLGIGKDDSPIMSTNFEQMKNRKWRISYIDPFASNIIAVFYKCKDGNKVMILLNEHAIPLGKEQCRLCPWETIEALYSPITSDNASCNLNVCKSSAAFTSISLTVIIFAYLCGKLETFIYF